MSENFYTILTNTGKAQITNASALGTKVNFTTLKLGDSNGTYYNPTESQTALIHEVWSGNINNVTVDTTNSNWIVLETVIPADAGGFMIREAGILDDKGNLLAISKYPETYKPEVSEGSSKDLRIKIILQVTNSASVTLKIDPSVTLATKEDLEALQNKIPTKASDIKTEDGTTLEQVKEDFESHSADYAALKYASVYRLNKDANGIFSTIQYKRKDTGKLLMQSILSGGTSPQYTTRTETWYDVDGTTVATTLTYPITYDLDGDWTSEV